MEELNGCCRMLAVAGTEVTVTVSSNELLTSYPQSSFPLTSGEDTSDP